MMKRYVSLTASAADESQSLTPGTIRNEFTVWILCHSGYREVAIVRKDKDLPFIPFSPLQPLSTVCERP